MEVQIYMLNPFRIILFYKVVGWFDGQDIDVEQGDQSSIPFTNMYYVEYVYIYIYIYTLYMCVNV
jgi:hypothetical protein